MKVEYKGFDIEASREKSMVGDTLLFYSVFRQSDGYEVAYGYSYGNDRIPTFIKHLKGVVDDFIKDPEPYYAEDAPFGDDCPPDDYIEEEI